MRRRKQAGLLVVLATAALMWPAGPASAAAGDLDPAFNGGAPESFVLDGTMCSANCALADVAHRNGKILMGGTVDEPPNRKFGLARLKGDGTFDPQFGGGDGQVVTPAPHGEGRLFDLAILPSGKILAAGTMRYQEKNRFLVFRYRPDGTIDPTFGDDGRAIVSYPDVLAVSASLALVPDGFVVAGTVAKDEGHASVAVTRFLSNGDLNRDFSGDGKLTTRSPGASVTEAVAVRVDPQGRIVVGGRVSEGQPPDFTDTFLARYLPDGRLDHAFSGDGLVRKDLGTNEIIEGMTLQGSRIVVVGSLTVSDTNVDMLLARFRGDGTLDATFGGGDGMVTLDFGMFDLLASVTEAPDGKLVAAGRAYPDFAVARFGPNGKPDANFGADGITAIPNSEGTQNDAEALFTMNDGRVVAAGRIEVDTNSYEWAVVRLLGS